VKMFIATALAVVAVVCSLVLSPELRHKAEDILFGKERTVATNQPGAQAERPSDRLARVVKEAPGKIRRKVSTLTDEDPGPETPVGQQSTAAPEPRPEPAPAPARTEQAERAPAQPAPRRTKVRISLPRPFHNARFGMTEAQLRRLYRIAWESNDYTIDKEGTRVLVYYITEDKSQSARFRLSNDSLFEITVHLQPRKGQTLQGIYEHWRKQFTRQYAGLPEARRTRWSDGTIRINIGLNKIKNFVWIEFQCPAADK